MKDLFIMGGATFMSILTLEFIIMLSWFIYHFLKFKKTGLIKPEEAQRNMQIGKAIGLFALISGITGQLAGLTQAFDYISQIGNVSPKIMFNGIKVSMITTFYGIIIYLVSIIFWGITTYLIDKKKN